MLLNHDSIDSVIVTQLRIQEGAKGAMPSVPVITIHKKDDRHLRRLIFHVSSPPPPPDNPGSDAVTYEKKRTINMDESSLHLRILNCVHASAISARVVQGVLGSVKKAP